MPQHAATVPCRGTTRSRTRMNGGLNVKVEPPPAASCLVQTSSPMSLLVSINPVPPQMLVPGLLATDVALRTLCEALTKAACTSQGLDIQEIQADYRPALTPAGRQGAEAEIYLYDTLPGGAGFVQHVGDLGVPIFDAALAILEDCPDSCDSSCYRCLRSYKNKLEPRAA